MNETNLRDQLKSLYEDTLAGRVDPNSLDGKRQWAEILINLSNQYDEESVREAMKMFYEAAVPEEQKLHDRTVKGYFVLATDLLTLGQAEVPLRVGNWWDNRLYKKVVQKKLGKYLRKPLEKFQLTS